MWRARDECTSAVDRGACSRAGSAMLWAMARAVWLVVAAGCAGSAPPSTAKPAVVSEYEPVKPTEVTVALPPPGDGAGSGSAGSTSTGTGTGTGTGGETPRPPEQPIVFGLLDGDVAVEEAWERWRAGKATTFDAAFEIAVLANRGRPVDMSDELMVIALARAVELSNCEPERLGKIRLLATAVHTAAHAAELDRELLRLADVGPVECASAKR
jgi:hypothetical protein